MGPDHFSNASQNQQMEPRKASGDFQRNLNTALLTLCVMGIGWVLKEVNNLDSRMAAQEMSRTADREDIIEMNKAMNEQSKIIESMDLRLSRVETIQAEKAIKQ